MKTDISMAGAVALGVLAIGCAAIFLGGCSHGRASGAAAADEARTSVGVVRPRSKSVQGELVANGILHGASELKVVSETQGRVLATYIEPGMRVLKGEVLAQVDDELKQAAAKAAQAAYDKSKSDWERAQSLFAQRVISESDRQGAQLTLANAESQLLVARRDLEHSRIRAPGTGVVTERLVSAGSMLSYGSPVATVVDDDNLRLEIRVGERDILKVGPGMAATIESDLYPGQSFQGSVFSLSPKGDSSITFPVGIALRNEARRPLYDGMSAKARIGLGSKTVLVIPRVCLVGSPEAPEVYVVEDGGSGKTVASLRPIYIGDEYGTEIEVRKGLSEKDLVVQAGANNLSDGAAVVVRGGMAL